MGYPHHMARQRRGGFKPPELKGTLGTLLRTTIQQAGAVREVLTRGAREGRTRLDEALSKRRREDSLAELGEIVLGLIRRGEIDVGELPEVREIVAHLDEVDAGHADDLDEQPTPPPARSRFDARGGKRLPRDEEDGTVAATTWSPPKRAKSQTKVWRPKTAGAPPDADGEDPVSEDITPPRGRATVADRPGAKAGQKKGGITFEDDDLADYMHPDDVPPKKADGGGGDDPTEGSS